LPRIVTIVLNWNNAPDTLACLDSLAQVEYPNHVVLVVDSGSDDGSVASIRAAWPTIEVIESGVNLGYAGGNNLGIRRALEMGADYICILNNDVVVEPGFLAPLVAAAEADHRVALLGPKVLQRGRPGLLESAGMVSRRRSQSVVRGRGEADRGQYDAEQDMELLSGCALLIRAMALADIGLLDERFFLYEEDIDWCLCSREHGYRNRYVPASVVYHAESNSETRQVRATYYVNRNRHLLCRKHRLGLWAWAMLYAHQLYWLLRWTVGSERRSKRALREAMWLGLRHGAQGRFGPLRP
jgi:GT2 family glycosyltransferase